MLLNPSSEILNADSAFLNSKISIWFCFVWVLVLHICHTWWWCSSPGICTYTQYISVLFSQPPPLPLLLLPLLIYKGFVSIFPLSVPLPFFPLLLLFPLEHLLRASRCLSRFALYLPSGFPTQEKPCKTHSCVWFTSLKIRVSKCILYFKMTHLCLFMPQQYHIVYN